MQGVPVFCSRHACYAALANIDLSSIEAPVTPSLADLSAFLYRLAYAQWTLPELREGKAISFMMRQIDAKTPKNPRFR